MKRTLHARTLALLNDAQHTYLQLYDATGIRPDWIKNFKLGRIKHPNVDNVQALYEHMTGKTLRV